MEIMDSSILRPEEEVRQNFLKYLKSLGFPEAFLVVEKALSELPHIKYTAQLPLRRIDILAYGLIDQSVRPLVLIECKASKLDHTSLSQALGYNHFIQAPFIALVAKSGYLVFNCITNTWMSCFEPYNQLCLQARDFFKQT